MSEDGFLVLVVGASGAGKDSVLREAERLLAGRTDIVFMRRFITRELEPTENHIAISATEFDALDAARSFSLCWRANGLAYGIGRQLEQHLADGKCCVCSVSRTVVADGRRLARALVVEVTASPEQRNRRLIERGRESDEAIALRLERGSALIGNMVPDVVIDNGGELGAAVNAFVRALLLTLPQTAM